MANYPWMQPQQYRPRSGMFGAQGTPGLITETPLDGPYAGVPQPKAVVGEDGPEMFTVHPNSATRVPMMAEGGQFSAGEPKAPWQEFSADDPLSYLTSALGMLSLPGQYLRGGVESLGSELGLRDAPADWGHRASWGTLGDIASDPLVLLPLLGLAGKGAGALRGATQLAPEGAALARRGLSEPIASTLERISAPIPKTAARNIKTTMPDFLRGGIPESSAMSQAERELVAQRLGLDMGAVERSAPFGPYAPRPLGLPAPAEQLRLPAPMRDPNTISMGIDPGYARVQELLRLWESNPAVAAMFSKGVPGMAGGGQFAVGDEDNPFAPPPQGFERMAPWRMTPQPNPYQVPSDLGAPGMPMAGGARGAGDAATRQTNMQQMPQPSRFLPGVDHGIGQSNPSAWRNQQSPPAPWSYGNEPLMDNAMPRGMVTQQQPTIKPSAAPMNWKPSPVGPSWAQARQEVWQQPVPSVADIRQQKQREAQQAYDAREAAGMQTPEAQQRAEDAYLGMHAAAQQGALDFTGNLPGTLDAQGNRQGGEAIAAGQPIQFPTREAAQIGGQIGAARQEQSAIRGGVFGAQQQRPAMAGMPLTGPAAPWQPNLGIMPSGTKGKAGTVSRTPEQDQSLVDKANANFIKSAQRTASGNTPMQGKAASSDPAGRDASQKRMREGIAKNAAGRKGYALDQQQQQRDRSLYSNARAMGMAPWRLAQGNLGQTVLENQKAGRDVAPWQVAASMGPQAAMMTPDAMENQRQLALAQTLGMGLANIARSDTKMNADQIREMFEGILGPGYGGRKPSAEVPDASTPPSAASPPGGGRLSPEGVKAVDDLLKGSDFEKNADKAVDIAYRNGMTRAAAVEYVRNIIARRKGDVARGKKTEGLRKESLVEEGKAGASVIATPPSNSMPRY